MTSTILAIFAGLGVSITILSAMRTASSNLDPLTAENLRAEILDLWLSGVTPVKTIIMVTHNVEEAVLMADRIVILTPRPAKIAKIVEVTLPRPRNRKSKEFQDLVDLVYEYVS